MGCHQNIIVYSRLTENQYKPNEIEGQIIPESYNRKIQFLILILNPCQFCVYFVRLIVLESIKEKNS